MTMAMDINGDDDDEGNDASLTTSDKGDNCNRDNGKDTCTLTTQCLCIGGDNNTTSREAAAHQEAEAVQRVGTQQSAGTNKDGGLRIDA